MRSNTKSSSYYHSIAMAQQQQKEPPLSPLLNQVPTNHNTTVSPMNIDIRDEPASPVSTSNNQHHDSQYLIPSQQKYPLPDHAIRTRCYKLNLNAEPIGFLPSITQSKSTFLGPFTESVPNLTFSNYALDDDDNDDDDTDNEVAVAIQTAQIFRGITVSADGTILSQNARATRCCCNNNDGTSSNKRKISERSRQAAQIDKANDLIEQDGAADSKLVSLVVMGEYDDIEHLVRDGLQKLREADGLLDSALYAMNRPRVLRSSTGQSTTTSPQSVSGNNNNNTLFMTTNKMTRHGISLSTVLKIEDDGKRTDEMIIDEQHMGVQHDQLLTADGFTLVHNKKGVSYKRRRHNQLKSVKKTIRTVVSE
jgi:hypothetical protein